MISEAMCNIRSGGDKGNVRLEIEMIATDIEGYKRAIVDCLGWHATKRPIRSNSCFAKGIFT